MKKLVLISAFIIPLNLCAQNWSTEEKAILEKVKIGWQSWEEAINQQDYSIWLKKANPSDNLTVWGAEDGGLRTL